MNKWTITYSDGRMERAAVAIEEKIGTRQGHRHIGFIDCNCLETDRPGGGPSEAGANSSRWDSEIQRFIMDANLFTV